MVLKQNERDYIASIYEESDGLASNATKLFQSHFGYSVCYHTVTTIWRDKKYKIAGKGGPRNGLTRKQIIELHQKHNGDLRAMTEEARKYLPRTLRDRCKTLGLEVKVNTFLKRRLDEIDNSPQMETPEKYRKYANLRQY